MTEPNKHPDYRGLPQFVRDSVSEKQFCWLTEREQAGLADEYVYPEPEDD